MQIPPVGVMLHQHMVQKKYLTSDGETKKQSYLQREVFGMTCSVDDTAATLHAFLVSATVDSPSHSK